MTYHESLHAVKHTGRATITQAVNVDTGFNPLPSIFVTEARVDTLTGRMTHRIIDYRTQGGELLPAIKTRIEEYRARGINLNTGEPNDAL